MKDLISKLTFGFLMAQFVPGCIAVIAISMLADLTEASTGSFVKLIYATIDYWFTLKIKPILFILLSTAAGMTIHGLNWMIIGFLEAYYGRVNRTDDGLMPIRKIPWHDLPLWRQLLFGPCWMIYEIILMLRKSHNLRDILIEENVGEIPKDKMEAFQFLQDFYLHFAQFYLHTSYALILFLLPAFFFSVEARTAENYFFLISVYFLASYFFLVGRVQMSSLFKAEGKLKAGPGKWQFKDHRPK